MCRAKKRSFVLLGYPGCDLADIDLLTAQQVLVVVRGYKRAVGRCREPDNGGVLPTVSMATLTRNTFAMTDNVEANPPLNKPHSNFNSRARKRDRRCITREEDTDF